jgi:uncharacterized repeat protein (TIGR03803 family)
MKKLYLILVVLPFTLFVAPFAAHAQNQTQLWGMTIKGGPTDNGVIFKTDGSGNNENVQYNFFHLTGEHPDRDLVEASDGKFYGTTEYGGLGNATGTLFQFDPITHTTNIFNFDGTNGDRPQGSLIQASDGMLYGMTYLGGANNSGVIFQFDPANSIISNKYDFDWGTGCYPSGSLIQASDGMLYGMASVGGKTFPFGNGILFQFDLNTSTFTKKIDFDPMTNGCSDPIGSLMQASDGMLYGMAGKIFRYDVKTSILTRVSLLGGGRGSLIQASDGMIYGMTAEGGINNCGVIFQFDPTTLIYTEKFNFNGANGKNPLGSLMQTTDGMLYGMTNKGGANDDGVLFQFDPSTSAYAYTKKLDFDEVSKGYYPIGSLIQASDGMLYGMTSVGGACWGSGVLFQYDPLLSTYTKEFDFGNPDGMDTYGSLMQASDGKLYGMGNKGGMHAVGVIFQYDPVSSLYTKKYDFDSWNFTIGHFPYGSLIQASDGLLYGMTPTGGSYDKGVLFKLNPATSEYTVNYGFDQPNGSNPFGSLMQASDGMLYGMTSKGGNYDYGVLFQFDPASSTFTKKFDFDSIPNGSHPYGSLVQAADGMLYGITCDGGSNSKGVLFQYDPALSIYTKKIDFDGTTNGSFPFGSLKQASDGKLYGLTNSGGGYDMGVLFQFDPISSSLNNKFDFADTTNGSHPHGSLIQASNGKLYGMTSEGGAKGYGVMFQFDPVTDTYTKKFDFTGVNGKSPYFNDLIEISLTINTASLSPGYCVGSSIDIPYTIAGSYDRGNVFTAQLSDASGSFASPVNIGSGVSTTHGNISATIPTNTAQGSGYRIRVVSSNPYVSGNDNGTNIAISVNSLPTVTANATNIKVCSGGSTILTGGGATSYVWSGDVLDGVSFVPKITTTYTVTGTAANTCTNKATITIAVNSLPENTGFIYGTKYACQGEDSVPYNVLPIANATSYVWTLPTGATTTSNTNSIMVKYGASAISGNITAMGINSCGNGTSSTLAVHVSPLPITEVFSGPISVVCQGQKRVNYQTISMGSHSNATSYIWTLPPGAALGTGIGSELPYIYLDFGSSATSGNLTITGNNECGNGETTTLAITVNPLPSNAEPIDGVTSICKGQNSITYTVPTIAKATSYVWNKPPGTSGQSTTNSIIVSYGVVAVSGDLTVSGQNTCGEGVASILPISIIPTPAKAGIISGISSVCQGQNMVTYSVPAITNASSYVWTLTPGATGKSSTNSIDVSYGATAALVVLAVSGSNTCGENGTRSTQIITINPKPATPSITQNMNILHSDAPEGNQWYNFEGLINGAVNEDYNMPGSNAYHVQVTLNGCISDPSNIISKVFTGVGGTEYGKSIKIYPNPVLNELIIENAGNFHETGFEILNALGKTVYSGILTDKVIVQTSGFSPGIYILKLENGKAYEFKKIIKE